MRKKKGLQFVWPKDGPKGRDRRGWFGRLDDILKGKGPDMFIQRQGSGPIRPERWGNWDSYHSISAAINESSGYKSREQRRYDPISRRYEKWFIPNDWTGVLAGGPDDIPQYPRFHADEWAKMRRRVARGEWPTSTDCANMGREWNWNGPNRFREEHDYFWQNAHRIGENRRERVSPFEGPNRFLRMHQKYPSDLRDWQYREGIWY